MDALLGYFHGHAAIALGLLVCCLPALILFRRQVVPAVAYALEIAFYLAIFHVVLNGVVRLVCWFKVQSTMYYLAKVDPGWRTPLLDFWNRSGYKPRGLFYFELAFAILIVYLVLHFRPYRAQRVRPRAPVPRKGFASSVRPAASNRSGYRR